MRSAELALAVLAAALLHLPLRAQTAVAPAAAASLPVVPVAPATQPLPPNRWTPAQIRQAFEQADADTNGGLSRLEVQRLAIVPRSFEDMDQNKDGVISREEFEGAFTR